MIRRRLPPALLVLATATRLLAQEPGTGTQSASQVAPPTFAVEVEQVIVDLVITDKKGNPVAGVDRDDLIVTEDGVPQTIVSYEAFELPDGPPAAAPPPPRVSTNNEAATPRGRTFVIVFDDSDMTPPRARQAKTAVASFLQSGVREGDSVTLIATSGAAWWTTRMESGRAELIDTLKGLQGRRVPDSARDRMSDWEAMRIHVRIDLQVMEQVMRRLDKYGVSRMSQADRSSPLTGTLSDPYVTRRASEVYYESRTRTVRTLEALERALNGLSGARGRKSVILVSEGLVYDSSIAEFKRVNAASRRANAAIYFVSARDLEGLPAAFSEEFGPTLPPQDVGFDFAMRNRFDDGSERLASESGGFTVKGKNDLLKGIQQIAKETQVYYLLGYVSSNTVRDGAFRELEVRFRKGAGKGLKIRARKGYYALSDTGPVEATGKEGIDPLIQAAVDSPWPEDGIPLRMTHYIRTERMLGTADVLIVAEVDIRTLEFRPVEGRDVAELAFLLVVAHRESGEFLRYDQAVTLRLRPSTRERLNRVWFPIVRDFTLSPGDHQARLVVREAGTERVGSLAHAFDVPALQELRMTTPILSDTHVPRAAGQGFQPRPVARREFPQGQDLVCAFEVYGAVTDGAGGPTVTAGHELRRADGTVVAREPPTTITPTSLGALSRQFGLSLRTMPLGEYELTVAVRDERAGKSLEFRETFTVVPPVPAPPTEGAGGQAPGAR